ncbi:MFS transporter [Streptomyces sp. NPDC101776]|uniref:MFS transporter n=1 Tax=Streptomyces sp. NPDC101776 TaxID=3366146 RepID=UPI003815EC5D
MSSGTVTPSIGRRLIPLGFVLVAALSYQIVVFPNFLQSLRAEPGWDLSPGGAGLVGSMIFLGMMAGATAAVPLARCLGRRRATLASFLWLTLWSGACAVAATPWQLGFLRMLTGIGVGAAVPLTLGLAQDITKRFKIALGIVSFGMPVAGLATQNTMGTLAVEDAWRLMTAVGAGVGLIALALSLWLLPRGTDMSVLAPVRAVHRKPGRRVVVWMGIGLIGANLIAWSALTGLTSADLRFNAVLNAGAIVAIFAVAGVAIHRSETPTSLSRTVRATVAFVLINPPTAVVTVIMLVNVAAGKSAGFVLTMLGVVIADCYCRSLTLSVAPRVFEDIPRPPGQKAGPTAPVPQPLHPGSDR